MATKHGSLHINDVLGRGDYLVTGIGGDDPFNHYSYLAMQGDGNLVLRRRKNRDSPFEVIGPGGPHNLPSGTDGTDASWCVLQRDGNLVLVNDHYVAKWGADRARPLGVQATLGIVEFSVGGIDVHAYASLMQDGVEVWAQGDSEQFLLMRKREVLTQFRYRFGPIPKDLEQAVESGKDTNQLTDWLRRIITVKDLAPDDLRRWLETTTK